MDGMVVHTVHCLLLTNLPSMPLIVPRCASRQMAIICAEHGAE